MHLESRKMISAYWFSQNEIHINNHCIIFFICHLSRLVNWFRSVFDIQQTNKYKYNCIIFDLCVRTHRIHGLSTNEDEKQKLKPEKGNNDVLMAKNLINLICLMLPSNITFSIFCCSHFLKCSTVLGSRVQLKFD